MARQPRFFDDEDPKKRKEASSRIDGEAVKAPPKAPQEPRISDDEIDEILASAARYANGGDVTVPASSIGYERDDKPVSARTGRYEDDGDAGPSDGGYDGGDGYDDDDDDDNDGGGEKKSGGKKLALMIVAILLGFAIIGTGVYALVHFVFMPAEDTGSTAATETAAPTMPAEPTLTPVPTQTPTQAPPTEPDYAAMADTYMKNMSDRDKMCQLFIVTPEVLTSALDSSGGDMAVTLAGSMTEQSLKDYPVGGVIYFSGNLADTDQTETMIANSQKYASTPLFIAVDEEGGDVARVADKLGTKKFHPMLEYKDQGEQTAHDNAETIGSNLRALGFNVDNAPVADVLSNPDNTVIGSRAYSDDFAQAATLVKAAVEGFHDGGVICVLKHFPGHGSTSEDSHEGLAYVQTTVDDLKKNELQPFKAGIEAGADMVMVGHLVVSDLDPEMPATLSSKVVPELLRKELGYDGVVISDSMSMGAIGYDYETIVKGLFAADVDIILQPDDLDSYLDAMQSLLESGDITMEQIDAKVKRILTLKYKQGVMKATAADPAAAAATDAPAASPSDVPATEAATVIPTDTALPTEQPSVTA